ncbi:lysosomal proton-coupled steroid conjugate and bile acid symporter SLC46A3-like [Palaemon carinicauda]|uniref:lysosomal proton-coupled steroid conjugate and bile acid symporter SLC46A3-like n=1 Tax=Palaemon carinicauda TaxID=392227 RepID=UPI0035B69C9E
MWILSALSKVTIEPVMLIDGACNQAMLLFLENIQMNKICSVSLNYSSEVCGNLSNHEVANNEVQKEFSKVAFYNNIILSVPSLIFVLFMGAWSDKYGRKIPLLITLICHVMYAGGYLINNWHTSWPVEILYFVSFVEALGGCDVGLLTSTISYISDITPEKSRTSRVSTANSMWYLGGPPGTLAGAIIIKYYGYNVALSLVVLAYVSAVLYVIFFIKESHGPFASEKFKARQPPQDQDAVISKENVSVLQMVKDFFNWKRVVESFRTALKKREGNTRAVLLTTIVANMIRRVARGFLMYMFVRKTLLWDATDYGYWVTYRNFLAAIGSLLLVPLMAKLIKIQDAALVVLGSMSMMAEYVCYGMIRNTSQSFLVWLGPVAGLISNACVIAFRSLSTKLVDINEKGRISAVVCAVNGLMPMVASAAYSPLYYSTVETFPAAQFLLGASLNAVIMIAFICVLITSLTMSNDIDDNESKRDQNSNEVKTVLDEIQTDSNNIKASITNSLQHNQVRDMDDKYSAKSENILENNRHHGGIINHSFVNEKDEATGIKNRTFGPICYKQGHVTTPVELDRLENDTKSEYEKY